MSDHQLPEDDDWLASMLEADRDVPRVSADMEARMLARLGAELGQGFPDGADAADGAEAGVDTGPDAAPPGPAPAADVAAGTGAALPVAAATGVSSQLLAVACAVSLALGGVLGYAAHDVVSPPAVTDGPVDGTVGDAPAALGDAGTVVASPDPSDAPSAEPVAGPEAPDSGVVRPAASSRRGTADASAGADVAPSATPAAAAGAEDAGAAAAPTRDEALADENALITQAQSALARGRASEALTALRDHQRRFPSGRFVEEREAMTVQALSRTGQVDAARARAERFYARYPNSLLTRAVRAAVQEP